MCVSKRRQEMMVFNTHHAELGEFPKPHIPAQHNICPNFTPLIVNMILWISFQLQGMNWIKITPPLLFLLTSRSPCVEKSAVDRLFLARKTRVSWNIFNDRIAKGRLLRLDTHNTHKQNYHNIEYFQIVHENKICFKLFSSLFI